LCCLTCTNMHAADLDLSTAAACSNWTEASLCYSS
jgi:hypothetical protein